MEKRKKNELYGEYKNFFEEMFYNKGEKKHIGWGFVIRDEELLVGEREDGKLIIPKRYREKQESYISVAQKSVKEDTGIETVFYPECQISMYKLIEKKVHFPVFPVMGENEKLFWGVHPFDISIYIRRKDTGESYKCVVISLKPKNPQQQPIKTSTSVIKNPRYVSLSYVEKNFDLFAPMDKIGVGIGLEYLGRKDFLEENGFIIETYKKNGLV